jgi:hypothetical protein
VLVGRTGLGTFRGVGRHRQVKRVRRWNCACCTWEMLARVDVSGHGKRHKLELSQVRGGCSTVDFTPVLMRGVDLVVGTWCRLACLHFTVLQDFKIFYICFFFLNELGSCPCQNTWTPLWITLCKSQLIPPLKFCSFKITILLLHSIGNKGLELYIEFVIINPDPISVSSEKIKYMCTKVAYFLYFSVRTFLAACKCVWISLPKQISLL